MKKIHASISFYMKPNRKSELKHIEVPKDFNDSEKIEDILIDRNRQHLGQAQGTFFSTPEIL